MGRFPLRLKKNPIIEAIVEFRFTPTQHAPLSDLLPGMLFSQLRDTYPKTEKLSISELPQEIRRTDPNLAYKPIHRLIGNQLSIAIGDRVLGFSCQRPYLGSSTFQPHVIKALKVALDTGLIDKIDRLAVKYINLIPSSNKALGLNALKASVILGTYNLAEHGCSIRTEIISDGIINIIQIVNKATVKFKDNNQATTGTIVDIDSILDNPGTTDIDKLPALIDKARQQEKQVFFSLLTDETLSSFEPVWQE